MNSSRLMIVIILLILTGMAIVGLLAWAPWITSASAERAALYAINKTWEGVIDGCGFNCTGCGVKSVRDVPFGAVVDLEYACGMIPADEPRYHETGSYFVSPANSVRELP